MQRPNRFEYYMGIAKAASQRSTCIRRKYGAVLVKNDRVVATGYNGAPSTEVNCCDIGVCWREENNIPHGERYEECRSLHAEMNAIVSAGAENARGCSLYLYGYDCIEKKELDAQPCKFCARFIKNFGIDEVFSGVIND